MLVERSIVFISKSHHLLSFCIYLCIKYLISPFQWIHPFVSILPQEYLQLLDSPVPIIVGIERADCKFIQDHCEILFVDLDQTPIVFLNKSEFMKNHDRDIIPLVSADFMDSLINLMNPYYSQDQIKRDQEMQILKHLEEFYRQKILHNLPQTPIFNSRSLKDCSKTLYDYDKMSSLVLNNLSQQGTQDKFLWSQFLKTQIFMQFIDQYYRKK